MLKFALGFVITIIIAIGWQNIVRRLASDGKIWVLVPEMTALAIMRDRALAFILVICSDPVWDEIKICCGIGSEPGQVPERQPQGALARYFGYEQMQIGGNKIIRLRKGLYFIGMPWIYQVYEWFLTETDRLSAKKALHSLTLSIMNIVYEIQKIDPLNGVINLMTADGVEVQAKITYYLTIRNPEKALFNIEHIKTFIRDLIIPAWRSVLSEFQFFQYFAEKIGEKATGEKKTADTPKQFLISAMQKLSQDLLIRIGVPENKETRNKFQELVDSFSGVAKILYDEGGIITETITISEFEPVNELVTTALENILIAKTAAEAAIQTATGNMEVDILDGRGKKGKLTELGEDAYYIVSIEAFQEAMKSLGNLQSLTVLNVQDLFGPILQQLQAGLGKK